jgi:hypothetical protein
VFLVAMDTNAQAQPQNEIRACRWFTSRDVATLLVSVPTREILGLVFPLQERTRRKRPARFDPPHRI